MRVVTSIPTDFERVSGISSIVHSLLSTLRVEQPRIIVFGDVMLDEHLIGRVERISPEAPIPVLIGETRFVRPGGAANVASNLATLGAAVEVCGLVGEDEVNTELHSLLTQNAVGVRGLHCVSGRRTTRKLRILAGTQQIVRVDFEDTWKPTDETLEHLLKTTRGLLEGANSLIVSDYGKGVCDEHILPEIIGYARSKAIPVLCDPKGSDYGKYRGATAITPNRREAGIAVGRVLGGMTEVANAASHLRKTIGFEACLITLGPQGMLLDEHHETTEIPAYAHDVADVTGAGDSVIAAIGLGVSCGLSLSASSIFANAVASIAVSKPGSVSVTLEEVASRFGAPVLQPDARAPVTQAELRELVEQVRSSGRTIAFTNGCFDLFHAGHLDTLQRCAELADFVIVGLNSDQSVRRLKGPERPMNGEEDRASVLLALRMVDAVVVFSEDTPEEIIHLIRPDVLVKGADYRGRHIVGAPFVESYGGRVELVEFRSQTSTTNLIRKLGKFST